MQQKCQNCRTRLSPYLVLCAILVSNFRGCRGDEERKGVVIAADAECRQIGSDILNKKNGSAVDATIATMLCLGVKMPHAMGVGGGFNMVVHNHESGKTEHIDAREMAPMATDIEFFNKTEFINHPMFFPMIKMGLLSIAIPGELAGYWAAHQRHGKLPWSELFQPAIKLARYGFPMTNYTAAAIHWWSRMRFDHAEFGSLCVSLCREDGSLKKMGDEIKMLKLADTLELIANKGPSVFYDGELTDRIVEELNSQLYNDKHLSQFIPPGTKYFTREDFKNYKVHIRKPFTTKLGNLTMYAPTAPGGGPVLGFMLKLLEGFNLNVSAEGMDPLSKVKYYHKLAEVMKFGFVHRFQMGDSDATIELMKKMRDSEYINDVRDRIKGIGKLNSTFYANKSASLDDGTLQISVMSANGDAVSVTSSINLPLGSYHVSPSTGIIFNNQMQDFTYPNYNDTKYRTVNFDANLLGPSKRPQSSQSPSIFIDETGEVRYVVGAAGGRFIIPAIVQVVSSMLYLGEDVYTAIDKPRFTHTLVPFTLRYEKEFDQASLRLLDVLRQKTSLFDTLPCIGRVEVIKQHNNGMIQGYSDRRKFVT